MAETGHIVGQSGKEFWIKTAEEIADDKSSKSYEDNFVKLAIANKIKPSRFDTTIDDLDAYRDKTRRMARRKRMPAQIGSAVAVAAVSTLILADGDSDITKDDRRAAWQDFLTGNTFTAGDIDNPGQIEEIMIASVDSEGKKYMHAPLDRGQNVGPDLAGDPTYRVAFALEYCSPGDTPEPDLGEINEDCKLIPVEVTARDLRGKDWVEGNFFGGVQ